MDTIELPTANDCECPRSHSPATPPWRTLLAGQPSPVCVRSLTPTDTRLLEEWFDALSPKSRRLRFFGPKDQLTGADRRRFLDLDDHCRHSLVATVSDIDGSERVVALAGFVCEAARAHEAEMAVAVIDEYHGRGLGTALLRRLGCSALSRGVTTLVAEVLWENVRMRSLLKHLAPGARGRAMGGGSIQYQLSAVELAGDTDCSAAA